MRDVPPADEVLEAVARTIADVGDEPADARGAFALRVAENLQEIVDRERADPGDPATENALAELVGGSSGDELDLLLDERLKERDADFDAAALPHLLADVRRRAEITRPGYTADA